MVKQTVIRTVQRTVGAVTLMLLAFTLSGCGYAVGPAFDNEVHTVYVETFNTDLFRRDLEFQLTEAIQRQVQTQTPLRLASCADADTKLSGRIVSSRKHTLGQSSYDEARQLELDLRIHVTWVDQRTGELLQEQEVALAPDVVHLMSEGDFAPEVGQSLATAYQVALDEMAREIVQMMETPW